MFNKSSNHQQITINQLFLDKTRQETLQSKNILAFWVYHRINLTIIDHRLIVEKRLKTLEDLWSNDQFFIDCDTTNAAAKLIEASHGKYMVYTLSQTVPGSIIVSFLKDYFNLTLSGSDRSQTIVHIGMKCDANNLNFYENLKSIHLHYYGF